MTPTLHCFAQSGNAFKAAMMLDLCGQPWQPVFVDFFKGATRGPDYLDTNEMAEVPVYTEGALRLTQSGVILDYLSAKHQKFGPTDEAHRREILRWTLWDNHKFTANIATGRFMSLFLPEEKRNPDVIAFLMGRAKAAMKTLERRLDTHAFVTGDAPTTADISCAGYIWFLEEIDIDPSDWPNIARWRDSLAALPGWRAPYSALPDS
ncbi:MAG: glutathione S-transferase family protein [Pseudomonadota bacterium]